MSLADYDASTRISADGEDFHALIMAAMRVADTFNAERLKAAFPETWQELKQRYEPPRGLLPGESDPDGWRRDEDGSLYAPDGTLARAA